MKKITVKKMSEDLNFKIIAGFNGIDKFILDPRLTKPGIELTGFLDFFDPNRVVLIGSKEISFMKTLNKDDVLIKIENIFKLTPPAFCFSKNVIIEDFFIEFGNKYNVPIIVGDLNSTGLSSKIYSYLQDNISKRISVHGVLLDIHGMGTLIIGESGIGKSEVALELVKRGHQLISDDRVDLYQKEVGTIIGEAPHVLQKYLEIRGIGIVDVVKMFGISAFRENKKIRLVVEIEKWDENKHFDRIGLETKKVQFFDTFINKIVIPVSPGRNIATLIEAAALNEKLKYFGYSGAKDFTDAVNKLIELNKEEN